MNKRKTKDDSVVTIPVADALRFQWGGVLYVTYDQGEEWQKIGDVVTLNDGTDLVHLQLTKIEPSITAAPKTVMHLRPLR